jgi:hypothetical protein
VQGGVGGRFILTPAGCALLKKSFVKSLGSSETD